MTDALPVSDAVIVGVGARAPLGLTALQVTMSVRAGKMDPRDTYLIDRAGAPMAMCRLPSIGDHVMGLERFVALGGSALTQAAFPWLSAEQKRGPSVRPLPLILALPAKTRPGFDARLEGQLLAGLEARSRVPLDHGRSASAELRARARRVHADGAVAAAAPLGAPVRGGDACSCAACEPWAGPFGEWAALRARGGGFDRGRALADPPATRASIRRRNSGARGDARAASGRLRGGTPVRPGRRRDAGPLRRADAGAVRVDHGAPPGRALEARRGADAGRDHGRRGVDPPRRLVGATACQRPDLSRAMGGDGALLPGTRWVVRRRGAARAPPSACSSA